MSVKTGVLMPRIFNELYMLLQLSENRRFAGAVFGT